MFDGRPPPGDGCILFILIAGGFLVGVCVTMLGILFFR